MHNQFNNINQQTKVFNAQINRCLLKYEEDVDYYEINLVTEQSFSVSAFIYANDANEELLTPDGFITVTGVWKIINNQQLFHITSLSQYCMQNDPIIELNKQLLSLLDKSKQTTNIAKLNSRYCTKTNVNKLLYLASNPPS